MRHPRHWKFSLPRLGLHCDRQVPCGRSHREGHRCLGTFQVVRRGNHIALLRDNEDGTRTPMTIPNHRKIKGSTLRSMLTQAGIPRGEFLTAYEQS